MFIEAVAQNAARGWEKFPDAMVKTGTFSGGSSPSAMMLFIKRTANTVVSMSVPWLYDILPLSG